MRILINDANILIDLVELDLLQEFSQLNFELCTTDFVLAEIDEIQRAQFDAIIEAGQLTIIVTETDEDYGGISGLLSGGGGLSVEDCSTWHYSRKMGGILVTGDGNLRKIAIADGIEVRGIIYLFDELLSQNLITHKQAIDKIKQLTSINNRLPMQIIRLRIAQWKKGKLFGDVTEEE